METNRLFIIIVEYECMTCLYDDIHLLRFNLMGMITFFESLFPNNYK